MYEQQNIMSQGYFEPYVLQLYESQKTTIVDTDYNSWAVIYNCATFLGFFVFEDYIVASKNTINNNGYSASMTAAINVLVDSFPDI